MSKRSEADYAYGILISNRLVKLTSKGTISYSESLLFSTMEVNSYSKKDERFCDLSLEELADRFGITAHSIGLKLKKLEKSGLITIYYVMKKNKKRFITSDFKEAMKYGIRFMVRKQFRINVLDILEGQV